MVLEAIKVETNYICGVVEQVPIPSNGVLEVEGLATIQEIGRDPNARNIWSSQFPNLLSYSGRYPDRYEEVVRSYDHSQTVILSNVLQERGTVEVAEEVLVEVKKRSRLMRASQEEAA